MSALRDLVAKNANASFPGRHAVVVGGTAGIGLGIARRLAQADYSVTIVGRNVTRGSEIVAELEEVARAKDSRGANQQQPKFAFVQCDVSLLANVTAVCEGLKRTSVDTLVLTQGKGSMDGRRETPEGLDQKMALHYFSRMLFVRQLLPSLRQSPAPRVLSVLSAGVHSQYSKYESDFELKENFSIKNAADAAGFYTDLMMESYASDPENNRVAFFHAAPGVVNTEYFSEFPWIVKTLLSPLVRVVAKSSDDCAVFMTDCLFNPHKNDSSVTGHLNLINENGGPAKENAFATLAARTVVSTKTKEIFDRILQA
ncbi:hypothetical protein HDU82_003960 [Entophlyctis luteolus]|nr:hypothetical protein HDU82_003960 [Entophlyctis luteolus]